MKFLFDIDDTILFSKIDRKGNYSLKSSNEELINKINSLFRKGHTIIIETGRHWNHFEITRKQLHDAGVCYDTLICGKPPCYIIDDKALRPNEFLKKDFNNE